MNRRISHFRAPSYQLLLFVVLVLLATLTAACTFEVQPIEEYRSQDGYLSLTFPAAWDILAEDSEDGTTAALVGSLPGLIDLDVIPPGEAGVAVMLLPDVLPNPGGEPMSVTPELMAELMRQSFLSTQETASEIEPVTLENGELAYAYTAYSPEGDMLVHTFSPAESVIAVVAYLTAPNEQDATLLADANVILNSVRFRGDPAEFVDAALERMSVTN
jgi:hypothetical protein